MTAFNFMLTASILVSALAVALSLVVLIDNRATLQAVREKKITNGRAVVAMATWWRSWATAVVALALGASLTFRLVVGLNPSELMTPSVTSWAIYVPIFLANMSVLALSFLSMWERRKVEAAYRQ